MFSVSASADDDDRTVHSDGAFADRGAPDLALPMGTRLGDRFVLKEVVGRGGFGIVYRASDEKLRREVAIKEYMPASFALRSESGEVILRTERHRDVFTRGRDGFIDEARSLAEFDHPALVKVFDFMQANGTAYMVMPFYRGPTLRQAIQAGSVPVSEQWVFSTLRALLGALATIHARQFIHRDIAPDNILILEDGRPLLLDFGAARRAIGEESLDFTVILKPGYAPVEQYGGRSSSMGAWTDVYALGAVVYWIVTGAPPPPSVGRLEHDDAVRLVDRVDRRFSREFLSAIDRSIAVRAADRPQTAEAFERLLVASRAMSAELPTITGENFEASVRDMGVPEVITSEHRPMPAPRRVSPWTWRVGAAVAAAVVVGAIGWGYLRSSPGAAPVAATPAAATTPVSAPAPKTAQPAAEAPRVKADAPVKPPAPIGDGKASGSTPPGAVAAKAPPAPDATKAPPVAVAPSSPPAPVQVARPSVSGPAPIGESREVQTLEVGQGDRGGVRMPTAADSPYCKALIEKILVGTTLTKVENDALERCR